MSNYILSCDWGTSSFRLRLVQLNSGKVLAETLVGDGIAAINELWLASGKPAEVKMNFFRIILQNAINLLGALPSDNLPVFLSGMASSTIGMKTLDYGTLPFDLSLDILPHEKIPADDICSHDILLISGLRSENDVMRGEETILLGCNIDNINETLLIFPGTHSKHLWIRENKLVDISTYMTGEFFDLLSNKSILSASVERSGVHEYPAVFQQGVADSRNANLLNSVFHSRTNQLFNKMKPAANFQYLSGLVIGAELNEIPGSLSNIILVSGAGLASSYLIALEILGFASRVQSINADEALLKGHMKLAV